ncbi:MAG: hypothetical protein NZM12_05755 [Steroidobacteraceae bacterium]|nr:hypothetical protein [Steroidobacteraceae bacterium]MDW8259533.1 hypothetical protein [Gammaproteobacteria bacterium]
MIGEQLVLASLFDPFEKPSHEVPERPADDGYADDEQNSEKNQFATVPLHELTIDHCAPSIDRDRSSPKIGFITRPAVRCVNRGTAVVPGRFRRNRPETEC